MLDGFKDFLSREYYQNTIADYFVAFLIILCGFILSRVARYVLEKYLKKIVERTRLSKLAAVSSTIVKPVSFSIVCIGIYYALKSLTFDEAIEELVNNLLRVLITVIVAYAFYRLCDVLAEYFSSIAARTETKLDDMLIPIVRKSLKVLIVILAVLFSLQNLGFGKQVTTILAGLGIGGLAFALAAKDSIANIVGSIMIFLDQPFKIGERILVEDADGVVEEVGLRSTKIRTLTGHLVTIPNNTIANTKIENISRRPTIRMLTSVGVTYDTSYEKLQKAVQIIKDILGRTEDLMPDYFVFFDEFGESSLNIFIIFWVSKPDYWLFKGTCEKVNFEIKRQFEEEGIEIAFPTRTIYLKQEKENLDSLAPKFPPEPHTETD